MKSIVNFINENKNKIDFIEKNFKYKKSYSLNNNEITFNGNLTCIYNDNIKDLTNKYKFKLINGSLEISKCKNLSNINLDGCIIKGDLIITDCPKITSINFLKNVKVEGNIDIYNCGKKFNNSDFEKLNIKNYIKY